MTYKELLKKLQSYPEPVPLCNAVWRDERGLVVQSDCRPELLGDGFLKIVLCTPVGKHKSREVDLSRNGFKIVTYQDQTFVVPLDNLISFNMARPFRIAS